jgi:predicted HD phosphohydrolase
MLPGRWHGFFLAFARMLRRMKAGFTSVDELFGALDASRGADDEGGLPILDHSLQCADLLRSARPDDVELQVAGLVHDLGWLERRGGAWELDDDAAHDVRGRELVAALLGPRVATLVGGHVAAKRYLLTTEPAYHDVLSARSETTLEFQGGLMSRAEVDAFASRVDRDDLVVLRRADDRAKVRGKVVPPLDVWRDAVSVIVGSR